MSMTTLVSARTKGKQLTLEGDWRRRTGTSADAHLFDSGVLDPNQPSGRRPVCGRRIKHKDTVRMVQGRPCADCLVVAIRRRASA